MKSHCDGAWWCTPLIPMFRRPACSVQLVPSQPGLQSGTVSKKRKACCSTTTPNAKGTMKILPWFIGPMQYQPMFILISDLLQEFTFRKLCWGTGPFLFWYQVFKTDLSKKENGTKYLTFLITFGKNDSTLVLKEIFYESLGKNLYGNFFNLI